MQYSSLRRPSADDLWTLSQLRHIREEIDRQAEVLAEEKMESGSSGADDTSDQSGDDAS